MKRPILKWALAAVLCFGAAQFNQSFAQFDKENLGIAAGLGYTGHAAGLGGSISYSLRVHYIQSEENTFYVSYNSQLPISLESDISAQALSSATIPSSVNAKLKQEVSFHNLALDFNRYFVGDVEESFGMYGILGAGLTLGTLTTSTSGYDKSQYTTGIQEESESVSGFMMNLGLGGNFSLSDKVALFTEARIGIPLGNSYNSRGNSTITNPVPFNYSVGAGIRYNLFY